MNAQTDYEKPATPDSLILLAEFKGLGFTPEFLEFFHALVEWQNLVSRAVENDKQCGANFAAIKDREARSLDTTSQIRNIRFQLRDGALHLNELIRKAPALAKSMGIASEKIAALLNDK
ncbi:MAG TPA: hypothetical protein VN873_05425 [Candidatus Angelobacter sp.]|nr:hypothetical protein [Candidatus Angelobacter sp.]